MAVNDQRGARWDHIAVEGCDFSATVTVAAAAVDLSGATITATIYNGAGTAIDTLTATVSGDGGEIVTLSLSDAEVDALVDPATWSMVVTRSGDDRAWFGGTFKVVAADRARNATTGETVTATVDTNVTVTATVLTGVAASTVGLDGGTAFSNYGGTVAIDGGTA